VGRRTKGRMGNPRQEVTASLRHRPQIPRTIPSENDESRPASSNAAAEASGFSWNLPVRPTFWSARATVEEELSETLVEQALEVV
jgi:hypothetical protein